MAVAVAALAFGREVARSRHCPQAVDLRPRARVRYRHHDLSRVADPWRGDAGGRGGIGMAVRRQRRGHDPGAPHRRLGSGREREEGSRHRARDAGRRRGAALQQGRIVPHARALARKRRHPGHPPGAAPDRRAHQPQAAPQFRRPARGARGAGSRREPRRSSQLRRPAARHGRHRNRDRPGDLRPGARRNRAVGELCHPGAPWRPIARPSKCCI